MRSRTKASSVSASSNRSRAAFTLVEILVTLGVAGILLALVYQIFISQQRGHIVQEEVADAQQNARVALEDLTRAVSSLGTGVDVEGGQVRILAAHPYEIVFNADLDADTSSPQGALPPGTAVPGARADDPYPTIPGSYSTSPSPPAETYRYTLDANDDGVVDDADRVYEDHFVLYRQKNGGSMQEVALLVANPRIGAPLFQYHGTFDAANSNLSTMPLVDTATSTRVANGEALDVLVRRVDVHIVTETATADPRYPDNDGYRQTEFKTSVTPRNLWDCPVMSAIAVSVPAEIPRDRDLLTGTPTQVDFSVTRGGQPEIGRTVEFEITGPGGPTAASVTSSATTGAGGLVTAAVTWPTSCLNFPLGNYTLTARAVEPPPLTTPFGTCPIYSVSVDLNVVVGPPESVSFAGAAVNPGAPSDATINAQTVPVESCGGVVTVPFQVLDFCADPARDEDVEADPITLLLPPAVESSEEFGEITAVTPLSLPLDAASGQITYTSYGQAYSTSSVVQRTATVPNPYEVWIFTDSLPGRVNFDIYPQPDRLVDLTGNIAAAAYTDCPDPALGLSDTFGVVDSCGNPLTTLLGNPFGDFRVDADLLSSTSSAPGLGSITSVGNPSPSSTHVEVRDDDGKGTVLGGAPGGSFEIHYTPPTCGLGSTVYEPSITLTPSWAPGTASAIGLTVDPCTSCSIQLLDSNGLPVTYLNRECEPEYEVVVTHCERTPGATVDLVITPLSGTGSPSFDDADLIRDTQVIFDPTSPPGEPQTARARLYMHSADDNSSFAIAAYMPSLGAFNSGALNAVTCQSEPIGVNSSCEQILISDVADNPQAVPSNLAPQDVPLCAAAGSEVFFRVKDCDQNFRDYASDDMDNLRGTNNGIMVTVRDWNDPSIIIDEEQLDILYEVDIHGQTDTDSPYFQGSLFVTQDPTDTSGSGLLRAPEGRLALVQATYRDPNDASDSRCLAQALLIPPLPLCLAFPVSSFQDWEGDLRVHGGDAVVEGSLLLPSASNLMVKSETAPLLAGAGVLEDRFFNAYVGGSVWVGDTELVSSIPVEQPFRLGGVGESFSTENPNFFQNVPDTAGMLDRLDYETLKRIAIGRSTYWVSEPGGLVRNPATGQTGTFQEVTALPRPGAGSGTHDGEFIFVDAPAALQSAGLIDSAALSELPIYTITGSYYTEGLLYVAGSVVFATSAGTKSIPVEAASNLDSRYDEAQGGFSRSDLPIDYATSDAPLPAGNIDVNVNGALYADGEIDLSGGPRIYGAVIAERGVKGASAAEIWYDPRWMENRLSICSECCGLAVSGDAPQVSLGDTLQLTASRSQGEVVWESLAEQVLFVDDAGLVSPIAEGTAIVRATDEAGCVAEVEVEVICGLGLDSQAGTDLFPGQETLVSASGAKGTLDWISDNPAAVSLDRNSGVSVIATAENLGGAHVSAIDTITTAAGIGTCEAALDFTVNCAGGRMLVVDPPEPETNDTVTLAVLDGMTDVSAGYTFYADGSALSGNQFTFSGRTPVSFEARLASSGACPVGGVEVTPACPQLRLSAVPDPVSLAETATLTVTRGVDTDVTSQFTFGVEPADLATVSGRTVQPLAAGTVRISGTDSEGCPVPPLDLTIVE